MDEKRTWIGALLRHRQVIPRWHSPQAALYAGERDSSRVTAPPSPAPRRWLAKLSEQVDREHADAQAQVELAETQFVLGEAAADASSSPTPASAALEQAQRLWQRATAHDDTRPPPRPEQLVGNWDQQEKANVARLRTALSQYPGQPLLWSELARAYIVLGSDDKAERAMACAVQLAGRSAYVRRSAARMFLHLEDHEAALKVVRDHPNFRGDPRMLSAEIAIASRVGKPSRGAKQGMTMLEDAGFRPTYLSELAAALGTVEMEHGKQRRSRALFAQGLHEPSENALAQIQWATEHDHQIVIPAAAWQTPRPFEAQALAARQDGNWEAVLGATERWLQEEPFAMRPAIIGSFASFTPEQNQRAESLASQALIANPQSVALHNNRAVARAYAGNLTGALADVRNAVGCHPHQHPYLVATLGLIAYRSGDHASGAMGYGTALSHFIQQKNAPSAVLAMLFWMRELARLGDPSVPKGLEYIKKHLLRITKGQPEPEIDAMLRCVENEVAQQRLPMPAVVEEVVPQVRELYEHFQPSREVVKLRDQFFEELSAVI